MQYSSVDTFDNRNSCQFRKKSNFELEEIHSYFFTNTFGIFDKSNRKVSNLSVRRNSRNDKHREELQRDCVLGVREGGGEGDEDDRGGGGGGHPPGPKSD